MTDVDPFEQHSVKVSVQIDLKSRCLDDHGYLAVVDRVAEERGQELLALEDTYAWHVAPARAVQEKVHASAPLWPECPLCRTHRHALHPEVTMVPSWMCADAGIRVEPFGMLRPVEDPKERKPKGEKRGWFR